MKNYKTYFTHRKTFLFFLINIITINGFGQIENYNFNHNVSIKPDYSDLYYLNEKPIFILFHQLI